MNNKLFKGLAAAAILASSPAAMANGTPMPEPVPVQEVVESDVTISGHVSVIAGYQMEDRDSTTFASATGGLDDFTTFGAARTESDHFRFLVDEAEINVQKDFGENFRLRADVSFQYRDGTTTAVDLEQAYVTMNIPVGDEGLELLVGRYDAPIGVESVDSIDNWFISYAEPFRHLTPASLLGAKLYYKFSPLVDLHFGVVNKFDYSALGSAGEFANSAYPSAHFRLGFNWGDEDNPSTFGISGAAGFENNNNSDLDFLGDIDAVIAITDYLSFAGEVAFKQDDLGATTSKVAAGFLALNYLASESWNVAIRAGGLYNLDEPKNMTLHGALGAGYKIGEGAKMKMEYRFGYANPDVDGLDNEMAHTLSTQFAYSF